MTDTPSDRGSRRLPLLALVAAAVVASAVGAAALLSGSDGGRGEVASVALEPPGTALGDGLVVPEGASLAGVVFREGPTPLDMGLPPPPTAEPLEPVDAWTAHLVVDGPTPFPVLDALAAQARDLGFSMAGTAAACTLRPRSGGPTAVVDATAADLEAMEGGDLECSASAGDGVRSVAYVLRWSEDRTGLVVVTGSTTLLPAAFTGSGATGQGRGVDRPLPPGVTTTTLPAHMATLTVPSAEPLPDDRAAVVPERGEAEQPAPGDLFGGRCNCLATGEDRLRLPEGMQLVATEGGHGGASVLVLAEGTDVEEAFDALVAAAGAGDPDDTRLEVEGRETIVLADGTEVRRQSFGVGAGGGAGSFLSSPDGRFVHVEVHSD